MASGLFSSIPIYPFFSPSCSITRSAPSMISWVFSSINLWSEVINGSHSAPFTISVSTSSRFCGLYLICVGNAAPPRPTSPLFLTAFIKSSLLLISGGFTSSQISCFLSVSMTMIGSSPPITDRIRSIPVTVPETLE